MSSDPVDDHRSAAIEQLKQFEQFGLGACAVRTLASALANGTDAAPTDPRSETVICGVRQDEQSRGRTESHFHAMAGGGRPTCARP